MTAKELQDRMLAHIDRVREHQLDADKHPQAELSVLRHLDGKSLLWVDQFVRSFRTERGA